MDKINRVIYKGIVACVVAVGIANVVDYFYAALHASAATSGSADFKPSVVINPTATITLSNSSASLAVTPNRSGIFAYTQTPIRVDARTNTPNDVAVNMVPSGSANTLVSGSNSIATLDTTSCATGCAATSSNFLNRWGYNVTTSLSAPSTYLPVLTTANQVLAYNNTAANISNSTATTRYVYFGMKVDQSTAPGTYSRALNFTVTVAPDPVQEDPTMQNVDSSKLAELMPNTGDTTTLEDERDGNTYTIAKLADGKYWMTTNLDLTVGTTLNASDSDVPSDNYYTVPTSSTFSGTDTGFAVNTGSKDCTNTSTGCYSYYSYVAATAGSGASVTSDGGKAAYSICPKGWRLPTATTDGVARDSGGYTGGDFYNMILAVTGQSSLANGYYESTANFYNAAGPNTTANFPLSGYYYSGSVYYVGSYGTFWSATSRSGTNAYYLLFYSSYVASADYDSRYLGLSVRCVFGS